jgi:hypothetical protein
MAPASEPEDAKGKKDPKAKAGGKPVAADSAPTTAPATDVQQRAVSPPARHVLVSSTNAPGGFLVVSVSRDLPDAKTDEESEANAYAVVAVTEDSSYAHFATSVQPVAGEHAVSFFKQFCCVD